MKINYYKELDGVRALAALMVMFFHFFQDLATNNFFVLLLKKYAVFGQTGVSLFFVLSGFLITRILLSAKNSQGFFKNFYLRRSLRIFPLYYLFLFIYYFILPFINGTDVAPFSSQVYYWIYMQGFAITFDWNSIGPTHFWSLAVEEHFYLFWPLLIYFLKPRQILIAVLVIIASAFIVRYLLLIHNYEVFYFTFSRLDELAIGAVLALLELKGKLTRKYLPHFVCLLISVLIPTLITWFFYTGSGNPALQVFKYFLLSVSYFSFIGCIVVAKESNWLKKIFKTQPMEYTGKISYGLYVYHPLCYGLFNKYIGLQNVMVSFVSCIAFTYLVAAISYYLYEIQFLKLKKYFEYETFKNTKALR